MSSPTTNPQSVLRRLLLMVRELHLLGYQRLRIAPRISPSGMHWRCSVTPVTNIRREHGARLREWDGAAHYTSPNRAAYFGWTDAAEDSPRQLAEKFLARFPALVEAGRGADKPYADWYAEMLRATEPNGLPYACADWELPADRLPVGGTTAADFVPLPPPGEG
jgi:hypothetical protein